MGKAYSINVRMASGETEWDGCGLDCFWLRIRTSRGFLESGNEASSSKTCWRVREWLCNLWPQPHRVGIFQFLGTVCSPVIWDSLTTSLQPSQ
jgi:hypothetical protein